MFFPLQKIINSKKVVKCCCLHGFYFPHITANNNRGHMPSTWFEAIFGVQSRTCFAQTKRELKIFWHFEKTVPLAKVTNVTLPIVTLSQRDFGSCIVLVNQSTYREFQSSSLWRWGWVMLWHDWSTFFKWAEKRIKSKCSLRPYCFHVSNIMNINVGQKKIHLPLSNFLACAKNPIFYGKKNSNFKKNRLDPRRSFI